MKNTSIDNVLVPVDFSEVSRNALNTAIAVCKRQLAKLTLIHVVEQSYATFTPEAGMVNGVLLPELVKSANQQLSDLARSIRLDHELIVDHIVQAGDPATEICQWSVNKNINLIIMGTNGASGLQQFILGTTASDVIQQAVCPVMTIPGNHTWLDFKKVLLPIHSVQDADQKYLTVQPILKKNGSSVVIAGIVKDDSPAQWTQTESLVERIQQDILLDDVPCETQMHACKNEAQEVLAISEAQHSDLVVILTEKDRLVNLFTGNYTKDIVHHAQSPVLSVKPSTRKKKKEGMTSFANKSPM